MANLLPNIVAIEGFSTTTEARAVFLQSGRLVHVPFNKIGKIGDIAALDATDGNIIVGNGTTWVAESGNTARTSLGLGTGDSPTFTALTLSNGQLVFPATQVPSAGANTLDDYEEGTFTPRIDGTSAAGSGTYTSQDGHYTKIGNIVFYRARCVWTAHTGTGNMVLEGLPFTVGSLSAAFPQSLRVTNLTWSNTLQAIANVGTTQVVFETVASGAAAAALPIDTAATILVAGCYLT